MDCNEALELYDDFRDQELDRETESALIEHLNSCPTCSMDFDMRDTALGALQNLPASMPPMSNDLDQRISAISKRRSAFSFKTLSVVLAAACALLMAFPDLNILHTHSSGSETTIATVTNNNLTIQKLKKLESDNTQLVADKNSLTMEVSTLGTSNNKLKRRVTELEQLLVNQEKMLVNQEQIKGKLDVSLDELGDIHKLVKSVNDETKKLNVIFSKEEGQAIIYQGQGWEDEKRHEYISGNRKTVPKGIEQRTEHVIRLVKHSGVLNVLKNDKE